MGKFLGKFGRGVRVKESMKTRGGQRLFGLFQQFIHFGGAIRPLCTFDFWKAGLIQVLYLEVTSRIWLVGMEGGDVSLEKLKVSTQLKNYKESGFNLSFSIGVSSLSHIIHHHSRAKEKSESILLNKALDRGTLLSFCCYVFISAPLVSIWSSFSCLTKTECGILTTCANLCSMPIYIMPSRSPANNRLGLGVQNHPTSPYTPEIGLDDKCHFFFSFCDLFHSPLSLHQK